MATKAKTDGTIYLLIAKPTIAWAVFAANNKAWPDTVSYTRKRSIELAEISLDKEWKWMKKKGCTCRKIQITEAAK